MRLGSKRHIYFKINRGGRKKLSGLLLFLLLLSLLTTGCIYFYKMMRPTLLSLTKNQAQIAAEQAVHRVADELFTDSQYRDFLTFSYLEDGTVSAVTTNTQSVNRLKAAAALSIQQELSSLDETDISVPLGSITGIGFFTGLGPYIPIEVLPYGHVIVDFKSEFTETGINQTHLKISLTAKTSINTIVPTATLSNSLSVEIPIVQTVIVGKVPESYVKIDRLGDEYEDDVMNLLPG